MIRIAVGVCIVLSNCILNVGTRLAFVDCIQYQGHKNLHRHLSVLLEPLSPILSRWSIGFRGSYLSAMKPRYAHLSDGYTPDRCTNSSPVVRFWTLKHKTRRNDVKEETCNKLVASTQHWAVHAVNGKQTVCQLWTGSKPVWTINIQVQWTMYTWIYNMR